MIRWLLPLFSLVANRASRGLVLMILVAAASAPATGWSAGLRAGAATVSVTPDQPVALWGQMHTRVSAGVALSLIHI